MSLDEHKGEAPSAWRIATMAWRSLSVAAGYAPAAFLAALAIVAAALVSQRMLASGAFAGAADNPLAWSYILRSRAVALGFDLIQVVAVTLVVLPVYRGVLREEATAPTHLLTEVALRVAAWMVAFRVLMFALALPSSFARAIATATGTSFVTVGLAFALEGVAIQVLLLYVWARFGLLYPALALDVSASAEGRLRDAWRLSAPIQWRIMWSALIAFFPVFLASMALAFFAFWGIRGPVLIARTSGISWGGIIGGDVLVVVSAALGAAVLAWNYRLVTGRHHELTAETFV